MAGRTIRATCFGSAYGQTVNITPHFIVNESAGSFAQMIAELKANFLPHLRPLCITSFKWLRIDIKEVTSPEIATYTETFPEIAGTNGSFGQGPQMAFLWSLQTGFSDRSRRGRLYIPGAANNLATDGNVSSSGITANNTAITNVKNRYLPGGTFQGSMSLAVWSRKNSEATQVTNIAFRTYYGTQRRRVQGVGI